MIRPSSVRSLVTVCPHRSVRAGCNSSKPTRCSSLAACRCNSLRVLHLELVSNELRNYCRANRYPRLDEPGSIGAPGHEDRQPSGVVTPKRSLVPARPRTAVMRSATLARFDVGQGRNALNAVALDEPGVGSPDRVLICIERSWIGDSGQERRCADSDGAKHQLAGGGAPRVVDGFIAAQGESQNPQPSGDGLPVCQCRRVGLTEGGSLEHLGLWEGVLTNLNGRTAGGSESGDAGANDRCSHRWLARPIDHVL